MTETNSTPREQRVFRVEGFGEVGYANLAGYVPHNGQKSAADLEISEMSTGVAQLCSNRDTIRIWRVK